MPGDPQHMAILGAGSWGTALAVHLGRIGHDVALWGRDATLIEDMLGTRTNPRYIPDVTLPHAVLATAAMDEALADASIVIIAVPSHGVRTVLRQAAAFLPRDAILVSATKGLEEQSLNRMSDVIAEEAGGLPTAVVVASGDADAAARVQEQFRSAAFRLYVTDDVAGVEIGGALKNVIAIAAGAVEGLGLGHNSMAALITRGLAEVSRLARAEGARADTLAGLSGLGDLVLTCTGDLSRNRYVGIELGRGRQLNEILRGMRMVAEGVRTTFAALALGERHGIELPIASEMAAVLEARRSPREAVEALMLRPQRPESDH